MTDQPNRAEALLPCPFCGGEAKVFDKSLRLYPIWWVECSQRPHPHHSLAHKSKEEAIAAWNTRATPEAAPVQGVKVRALEWINDRSDECEMAKTVVGDYEVGCSRDGYAWAQCDGPGMWEWTPDQDARLLTISDAKAAAQADYAARILAALEPTEAQGWRTMDSVPQDQTRILAASQGGQDIVWWSGGWDGWLTDAGAPLAGELTHWMPLPIPPAAQEGT